MIDLKYHIYSLVAVFLALAVGVLIGIPLGGGPTGRANAIEKQSQLIKELNDRFHAYTEKMTAKQASIDHLTQSLKEVDSVAAHLFPSLVSGALAGRGVAIVQLGQDDDLSSATRKSLEAAGAIVNSVTKIDTRFHFTDPDAMAGAAKVLPLEFQDSSKEPYKQIWGYFVSVLASGRPGKPLDALAGTGILQTDGNYGKPNRFVVMIGPASPGNGGIADTLGRPLAERIKLANMKMVIVTRSNPSDDKVDNPWTQLDVPTVTDGDWTFGQICVVDALVSGEGRYGLGPSEKLLPGSLTDQ